MGLLDNMLGSSMDDPKTLGLLQLASSLSSGQKFVPALSQGLLGRAQIMGDAKRQEAVQQIQAMQLAQMQRQAKAQEMQDAFRASIPSPQMAGVQGAMLSNGGPTNAAAAAIPKVDPTAQMLHGAMQAGLIDPLQYLQAQRKDTTPLITKAGDVARDPVTGKVLWQNDDKDSADPFVRLLKQSGIDPMSPQGQQYLRQRLQKETTHTPGTNVTVNAGPKAFETEVGKLGASILEKGRESAQAAAGTLESVAQIRQAAAAGAYQGAGADLKLGAAKALGALGMPYDAKTVANSELFSAQANLFVLNSIKGLGANPSNADREFIEKTVPHLQTDPAALPALLDFIEGKARRQIGGYNQQARKTQQASPFLPFSLEVQEPQTSGGLSPAEQQELAALRARLGGKR